MLGYRFLILRKNRGIPCHYPYFCDGRYYDVAVRCSCGCGINTLIKAKVDLSIPRNLCIASVVMTFGIGGMLINIGEFSLKGISLCALVAIVLNIVLPKEKVEDSAAH